MKKILLTWSNLFQLINASETGYFCKKRKTFYEIYIQNTYNFSESSKSKKTKKVKSYPGWPRIGSKNTSNFPGGTKYYKNRSNLPEEQTPQKISFF